MGRDADETSPPVSSSELEQEEDDDDCYLSDQENDALEESVLQVLEDKHHEDCHWSASSVITKESLLAAQREDLRKVMELLGLREHHARTLLITNEQLLHLGSELRWSKEA